jgi:AcrR family transcriptional regulator
VVSYQRARNPERKEERRQLLLAAARRLSAARPLQEIAIAEVAAEAGLAKGTVYLYFATKEELFLALTEDELWSWFAEVDARLESLRACTPRHLAYQLVGALAARPMLPRLLSWLHNVEHNLDESSARRYKQTLLERVALTGARLETLLSLSVGEGARALLTLNALGVGLAQMAMPSPLIARLLEEPQLAALRVDFVPALEHAFGDLLVGMTRRNP